MERLPAELQTEVCSYLSRVDLLALSRTCVSLAASAKPFLFETLTFHGDDQVSDQHALLRIPVDSTYTNFTRPVELASLETTIDKAMRLGISKYAKTLQYSPKVYVANFWPQYRDWVEEQINVEVSENEMDDGSDAWDSDDEWGSVGIRRAVEARRNRPEAEREASSKAELFWDAKVLEQEQRNHANHAALVRMFKQMPKLHSLQVMQWDSTRELEAHGIKGRVDEEVVGQFSDFDILNAHLETLGNAVQEAGIRIEHLLLPTVSGRDIARTPAVQHLFGALTSLSLDLYRPVEMLANYSGGPASLRTLFRCARNTLRKLEFNNFFRVHYHLPDRGEHLLENLWGEDPDSETGTFVFPRLEHLQFGTLILYAPSLIKFLRVQPELKRVVFRYVYLGTLGYSWADVAANLPSSCRSLYISVCGGQTTPKVHPDPAPNSELAYNHIAPFITNRPP
ncbi:hypothetical protein C7974DRAFT_471837, partial [Boeremia exigua]|uniref:uncharacterized protein n=1 Tax=Boeremia exigua TaxID=749465 RepID=UPI001E8CEB7B